MTVVYHEQSRPDGEVTCSQRNRNNTLWLYVPQNPSHLISREQPTFLTTCVFLDLVFLCDDRSVFYPSPVFVNTTHSVLPVSYAVALPGGRNSLSVIMTSSGLAFVTPLSVPTVTQPNAFLPRISPHRIVVNAPTVCDRRVVFTSVASDKPLTSTAEHSVPSATTPQRDDHPRVSTNFGDDTHQLDESCIKSLDDISELVQVVEECGFADFRICHNGVTVEITREGGRGFDADGCLKELPPPSYEGPVQATVPDQETSMPYSQNVPESYVSEIAESNGDTSAVTSEPEPSAPVAAEEGNDPDKIYDTDFVVTSNRVGFFFSGAKNKPPLVNVNDTVAFNQPVCIIEQLGQQYVYLSEAAGKVVKILVEDGDPVEYGSQVMVIRPD